ncbi:hypothetical protein L083_6957 [Actinoplanes sp. N902-109]|nr:hypothetical protein L083_6957 [Actinoplanes sp. N902-109]
MWRVDLQLPVSWPATPVMLLIATVAGLAITVRAMTRRE